MSVENDFIAFAVGEDANVLSQSAYAANTSLTQNGFSAGIAPSAQLNKVWRQSSIMAAVIAQFIVQRTGQAAIDDGTTATLLANLLASAAALNGDATQTFNVSPAVSTNEAVNLGQFTSSLGANGYQKLPSGLIIQWGNNSVPGQSVDAVITLPLAFPNSFLAVVATLGSSLGGTSNVVGIGAAPNGTKTSFDVTVPSNSTTGAGFSWLAIGN